MIDTFYLYNFIRKELYILFHLYNFIRKELYILFHLYKTFKVAGENSHQRP
jgi:hypothetical protein